MKEGMSTIVKFIKKYIIYVVICAFLISTAVFVYLNFKPATYRAAGKIMIYFLETNNNFSYYKPDITLTNSFAESINSRNFIDNLFKTAGVQLDEHSLNNLEKSIKTKVADDSNIINIEIYYENIDSLKSICDNFIDALNSSPLIIGSDLKIKIEVVDPLYVDSKPINPNPLGYALFTFLGILFVGLIIIYTFSPEKTK